MNENNATLEDLEIYQIAMEIGESIWQIVEKWEYFNKKTMGDQLVRASDSIAANIAEGYGRYFFKDRKQFCYYSRGSILESKTWLLKAKNRNLLNIEEYEDIIEKLKTLHFKLNIYIKKLKREYWIKITSRKYPKISISQYPNISISKYPNIQISQYLNISISNINNENIK